MTTTKTFENLFTCADAYNAAQRRVINFDPLEWMSKESREWHVEIRDDILQTEVSFLSLEGYEIDVQYNDDDIITSIIIDGEEWDL